MAQTTLQKPTAAAVIFVLNHKSWTEAKVSFQNNTTDILAVTITNENVQTTANPVFVDPPIGPLIIAVGAIEQLDGPFEAAEFAGTGTGKIDIVSAQ